MGIRVPISQDRSCDSGRDGEAGPWTLRKSRLASQLSLGASCKDPQCGLPSEFSNQESPFDPEDEHTSREIFP